MNIRRVSPIPWNTGTACPPIMMPHMSRPPCHGKCEQPTQVRFVNVIGFGKATEPEKKHHRIHRSQAGISEHTRGVQETNRVIQTLEFGFRKVVKILRVVIWEQVFEGWHQLDDRGFRPLFLQNSNCCICERPKILRDYYVLAFRLSDEVGDSRSRISG